MTDGDPGRPGRSLRVDAAAHDAFVALSGDRSPLHVDAAHARRTPFGGPVVHGVHLVLLALEQVLPRQLAPMPGDLGGRVALEHLDAEFRAHVGVASPFTVEVGADGATIDRGGRSAARVRWRFGPPDPDAWDVVTGQGPADAGPASATPEDLATLVGAEHHEALCIDAALLADLLPAVAARLAPADVAGLLTTTRLVGMRWPGERALLRRVRLERHDAGTAGVAPGRLAAEVTSVHRGTGLVRCEVRHGRTVVAAEAQARPPTVRQPPLTALRSRVPDGRFAGVTAWVVGGGRGLGEVAAKLLAAGGATVVVSGRGAEDVARVADEVGGEALVLDVTAPPARDAVARLRALAPTHLAHFAAPSLLPLGPDDAEGRRLLAAVLRDGLRTCVDLVGGPAALRGVLVPSSVLVGAPTAGLEAYAAVKAQVEDDLAALAVAHPHLTVAAPRLPQLLSDQTVGIGGLDVERTVDVLLPVLERWIPGREV